MVNRLFATNSLAGCYRSIPSIIEVTTAGVFDSNFVDCAIQIPFGLGANTIFIESMPFMDAASVTTFCMHCEMYLSGGSAGASLIEFYNATGTNVAQIINTQGIPGRIALQFRYWNGSAFVNHGSNPPVADGFRNIFDLKLVCGVGGTFQMWEANTPLITDPGGGLNAAVDNIAMVKIYGIGGTNNLSQWAAADVDLRDYKFPFRRPSAEGHYTDGTGAYTDVNELQLDDSNAIILPAHGNKHTFLKSNYTVPEGYAIAAGQVNARGRVSGGTITDGKLMLRSSTTDALSPALAYTAGYEPRGAHWDNDPATVTPWSQTTWNAAEFGADAP